MVRFCSAGTTSPNGIDSGVAPKRLSCSIWTGEPDPKGSKIRRLTIAPLLAEAIRRISDEASVSSLFD